MNSDKRSLLQFLVVVVAILVYCNWNAIVDGNVDGRMHQGLAANTDGEMIVAYYVDEDRYSKDFVPFTYQTSNPDDVGAILRITKEDVSQMYSGGLTVHADMIHVELIDCDTGDVINGRSFVPRFPATYKSGTSVEVNANLVMDWVLEQWEDYLAENK